MSRKKDSTVTVQVFGIEYPEFAKLKWQQFLRGFSLAVALLVLIVLALALAGKLPRESRDGDIGAGAGLCWCCWRCTGERYSGNIPVRVWHR